MIEFASNPVKVGVALLALSLSFWAYYKMRKPKMTPTRRAALTYFHLAMLFFPFLFFVYSMDCTAIGRYCAGMGLLETAALSLPVALALGTLIGFVIIPRFHILPYDITEITEGPLFSFVDRESRRLGMRPPQLFVKHSSEPFALSFNGISSPAVIVSVGMLGLLSKPEAEAVILHELAHLANRSSDYKSSALLARLLSPLPYGKAFAAAVAEEESKADAHAAAAQGTAKHLESARKKASFF